MGWMRTDYSFDNPAAILTLPRERARQSAAMQALVDLLLRHSVAERSEELEIVGLRVVHTYRPELIGCVLWFINFDPSTSCWEFVVSHGSLPAVAMGDCLPRMPIDFRHPMLPSGIVPGETLVTVVGDGEPRMAVVAEPSENSGDWFRRVMSQPAE